MYSLIFTDYQNFIMSLGQLTANYTDSEGEDDSLSHSANEDERSERTAEETRVPTSHSNSPSTGTPQKKVIRFFLIL